MYIDVIGIKIPKMKIIPIKVVKNTAINIQIKEIELKYTN